MPVSAAAPRDAPSKAGQSPTVSRCAINGLRPDRTTPKKTKPSMKPEASVSRLRGEPDSRRGRRLGLGSAGAAAESVCAAGSAGAEPLGTKRHASGVAAAMSTAKAMAIGRTPSTSASSPPASMPPKLPSPIVPL
nr:hypothetical protein [Paenibacillus sp. YYML68]